MGCSCVRRGEPCTNCTPSRSGRCENYDGPLACGVAGANPPAHQPIPHPSKEPRLLVEETESVGRMTVGGGGDRGVLLDNRLPGKEFATLSASIITSSLVVSTKQDESPDLRSTEVVEDPNELTNSSPLKTVKDLPPFTTLSAPNFRWGDIDGAAFSVKVDKAYEEAVHWKRNLFEVPKGKVGAEFVRELSRLLDAYSDATALESMALKASMILPLLLLQRPHPRSKPKDHTRCLGDRMTKWLKGDVDSLLHECTSIQSRLNHRKRHSQEDGQAARSFAKLVSLGNLKAAMRLITEQNDYGCLQLDNIQPDGRTVKDHLLGKHPPRTPASPLAISDQSPAIEPHSIVFDQIDGTLIRSISQQMDGSAGPSGLDAHAWKGMCSSFHNASDELCSSVAKLTRKLCSNHVDPSGISALTACRLIALDKCPGVRPIGVGETLRRLISKAILRVTRDDILKAVGSIQLCAGQEAACEAGIHAMRNLFEDEGAEAMLMVDASNAFNSLNREAALRNTRILCPVLAPMLTNMYRSHSMLFIDGDHILSQEGTTQGDPLAMAMYAIGTLPLIRKLHGNVTQVWYADDASAGGRTSDLRVWWDSLVSYGPRFGYNPNPCKTWLVVKPEHLPTAEEHFRGSGVNITIQGHRYLGAPLGSKSFVEDFIRDKISCWGSEIRRLSKIAKFQPQAAYAVFTHALTSRWTFLMRTAPGIEPLLQPLEEAIRHQFLPAMTGRQGIK